MFCEVLLRSPVAVRPRRGPKLTVIRKLALSPRARSTKGLRLAEQDSCRSHSKDAPSVARQDRKEHRTSTLRRLRPDYAGIFGAENNPYPAGWLDSHQNAFRARGIPVLMGGVHPSFMPDEALRHADAVVVGEAELIMAKVLDDLEDGCLRGTYKADRLHSMQDMPLARYDLIKPKRYVNRTFIQTSRGCHHACTFCAEQLMYGLRFRYRPVDEVMRGGRGAFVCREAVAARSSPARASSTLSTTPSTTRQERPSRSSSQGGGRQAAADRRGRVLQAAAGRCAREQHHLRCTASRLGRREPAP